MINCHFYDKFKAALFNCLNDRLPILTTFVLTNTVIDNSVIPGLATLIKRNPLRHLELRHLIKGKPMALPIEELFKSLVGKDSIKKLMFSEPSVKISGQVLKYLKSFLRSIRHLSILELECEYYEDIFESVAHGLAVGALSISSFTFDKYSVNKLFFDMA